MSATLSMLEAVVVGAIVLFSLRRLILLVAALLPQRRVAPRGPLPSVTIVVPARNERAVAGRLLAALERLDFPDDQLSLVLVPDGCTDDTPTLLRAWAARRERTRVIELPVSRGKAGALNRGLEVAISDLIVVLDADLAPTPDFLRELVRPFADERVGAAAAYLRPANANDNLVARYAAVTTWVHQLITSAGSDRLRLNPPTLGASAYRRVALEQIGGFPMLPMGEDVATSDRLVHAGWQTRFVPTAVADNHVASNLRAFWRQHLRWSRSVRRNQVSRDVSGASFAQRLELRAASIGYGDRLVFAIAMAGAIAQLFPAWVPLLYLAAPGLEIVAALSKARAGRRIPAFLLAAVAFFGVDLVASVAAIAIHASRRSLDWYNPRFQPMDAAVE